MLVTAARSAGLPGQSSQTGETGRRADLAQFRTDFLARDRAYSAAARAEAEARVQRLEASIGTVSQAYFELELARIVALADNGHTASFAEPRSRRYNRVPLRLVPFGEEFFVLRADQANADLLGTSLVAIDGRSLAELRAAARTLVGGTPAWRDRPASFLFESPEQLQALGLIGAKEAAVYRFSIGPGRAVERRLVGQPADPNRDRVNPIRWLYPQPLESDQGQWRSLLSVAQAPWALREVEQQFRWRDAPELEALVIELRRNRDAPNRPIADFVRSMRREITTRRPRHLVVDLRANGGGDLNTTRAFFQSLPTLVPGRIFVLTSPWTFSAAISSVGYLEQAAPDRVTIVGEEAGDRLEFWAEGGDFELSGSGAVLLPATERHDYRNGCRGFSDCHGSVVRHPISVPSLRPDLPAPWTIEAYRAGKDPGLEAVARALRARPDTLKTG
jgi:hypothetical protein